MGIAIIGPAHGIGRSDPFDIAHADPVLSGIGTVEAGSTPAMGADIEWSDRDPTSAQERARYDAMRPVEQRRRRALTDDLTVPAGAGVSSAQVAPAVADSCMSKSDAAVLERLNIALSAWVDESKARPYADRPSDLLRAVAKHRRRAIPDAFTTTLDPSLLADEALLDEAALLYDRLRRPQPVDRPPGEAVPSEQHCATLSGLRAGFLTALRVDYPLRRALDALFAPSASYSQTTPYFDGFALRNAKGKSFDDLLDQQAVWAAPALTAFSRAERSKLLARKFEEMGESTSFTIGSVPHSLASALLRIERYRQGVPVAPRHRNEAELVSAFSKCEGAWSEGNIYPFHPRLLFAAHLARSSDFEVLSNEQLELLYENQINDRALDCMANGNSQPAQWLAQYLSGWAPPGRSWKDVEPARRAHALLGLFDTLRVAADHDGPISDFARTVKQTGVLRPNRLVGADFEARAAVVTEYANERLLLAYGARPSFDRRRTAVTVLSKAGLSEEALSEGRHYAIAGDNPNVLKNAFGNVVDEFLDRADWVGLTGSVMTLPDGVRLNPRDELQREELAFNARLPADPWVVAEAKQRLRAQSMPVTPDTVRRVADEIARTEAVETESHRALMRGFETWINTVPVVGPIYNIEEGIRHRDAARAAFGLLFLCADVFDVGTGAGGARSEAVHPVVPRLRRALGRVDASRVNVAGHHEMIEMSVDPVHIAQPDADVPEPLRALAREARENRSVRWRNYDVVHLDLEDRIVPVTRDGEAFFEVDWRTRRRVTDAPAIEVDPRTGKGYAPEIHPRLGEPSAEGKWARERMTVKDVSALLERADDMALRDFDLCFSDSFVLRPPAANTSRFDARAFYRKLYESSGTFRRVFNRHAVLDAHASNATTAPWKKWEFVIGEAGPLGSPRKAYTDFGHKRIYLPNDADIVAMPYMSAAGVQTLTPEQAYLHEMVHALTGGRDPEHAAALRNRGPVVYLTDKILSEAGYRIPEQVMYRRVNATDDMPVDQTVEFNAQRAAGLSAREDRYLDALVDARLGAVTADTVVEGEPVSSRLTVKDATAVLDRIEDVKDEIFLSWSAFKEKFDDNFGFYVQDRTMTTELGSDAVVIIDFYGRLYQRSVTFRRMFDKMPVTEASRADPWKFVLEGDLDFQALSPGGRVHGVAESTKKIYVLDDGLHYLTESGLREVELERKLAYQMICAVTGLGKVPAPLASTNRGAAVYLTDRVLKEAGFNYPRQLVSALVGPGDTAAEAQLLARQTSAMRSASVEDRYLQLA
ncbi:PipA/GogA/GtgA family type III secretion system effector [Trinickia diaoshuihuensis]|uniref:PipA/GogA/GtgA family type III secretion system effector n=1 Tax=Trinickia diaoshuihuensis TaxID=2292265 RepID=UPI000E2232AC|nr:PipA/GogA/GtgA family type III secretion system effector [Trinickia diaoshuihuensis]